MAKCPQCKGLLRVPVEHPEFYKDLSSPKFKCFGCARIYVITESGLVPHPQATGEQIGPVKGGGKRARSGRKREVEKSEEADGDFE